MIPTKFRFTNYCQHTHFELDLSSNTSFSLVGPNATGKSNILNGIKATFNGKMSDSAERLSDDIFDFANTAILEGWLQFDNSEAYIKRTLKRKGANETYLLITNKDGTKEEITKATDANKRFEEILLVPTDILSEVIIAQQRSIEDLLFAKNAKRIQRFQNIWHGKTFSNILLHIDNESKKLFIDEYAEDRLKQLLTDLDSSKNHLLELNNQKKTLLNTQDTARYQNLQKKRDKYELFDSIQKNISSLNDRKNSLIQRKTNLSISINSIPNNIATLISDLENTISLQEKSFEKYNNFITNTTKIKDLKNKLEQLSLSKSQLTLQRNELITKQETYNLINSTLNYLNISNKLDSLNTEKTLYKLRLEQINNNINVKQKELNSILHSNEGYEFKRISLNLLEQTVSLYKSLDNSCKKPDCPTCRQPLTHSIDLTELNKRIDILNTEVSLLKNRIDELNQELTTLEQQLNENTSLLQEANLNISLNQTELSKIVLTDHKFLSYNTSQLEVLLKSFEFNISLLESIQTKLQNTESNLRSTQLSLTDLQTNLIEVEKPIFDLVKSKEDLQNYRKQSNTLIQLNTELDGINVNLKDIEADLKTNLTNLETHGFKDQTITPLDDQERKFLSEQESISNQLVTVSADIKAQEALQVQLNKQIKSAKETIEKSNTTKAYQNYLSNLTKTYKALPQYIIRSQLRSLCSSIDDIANNFKLRNSFRVIIDDNLNFLLKYPNGLERPINRASGGERIILGLAFRLAAHKSLAPEMPFLAIDEPTNHLDDTNTKVLADLVHQLNSSLSQYGIEKLLICTHSDLVANQTNHVTHL